MDPLTLAIALFCIAFLLLIVDLFVPSGGVLLVLAALAEIGSVLFAFRHSFDTGLWMLIVSLGSIPLAVWLFVKVWPNTPMGRRIISRPPEREDWEWTANPPGLRLQDLIGREAIVTRDLMPVGCIEVDQTSYEATAQGQLLEKGTSVEIVRIDLGLLVVQPISNTQVEQPQPDAGLFSADAMESLGIESLEDEPR